MWGARPIARPHLTPGTHLSPDRHDPAALVRGVRQGSPGRAAAQGGSRPTRTNKGTYCQGGLPSVHGSAIARSLPMRPL